MYCGIAQFVLDYNWDWNYDPTWTLMDKFGIAWTDDFDPIPSSAVHSYRAFASDGYQYTTGNIYTYDTFTPGTGIGWKYDIIDNFNANGTTHFVNRHKG